MKCTYTILKQLQPKLTSQSKTKKGCKFRNSACREFVQTIFEKCYNKKWETMLYYSLYTVLLNELSK